MPPITWSVSRCLQIHSRLRGKRERGTHQLVSNISAQVLQGRQISFNCLYKMARIPRVLKTKNNGAKQNQSRTACWPSWSSSGRRPSSGAVKSGTHLAAATFTSIQQQCLTNKGQTFPSERTFVHRPNWNPVIQNTSPVKSALADLHVTLTKTLRKLLENISNRQQLHCQN